jgi:hypothetical protein
MNALSLPGIGLRRSLWIATVLVMVAGCGGDDAAYHPTLLSGIGGRVTLDSQPLTTGVVTFAPDEGNPLRVPATGRIEGDGSYTISTGGRDGAPAGRYRVCVSPDPREEDALQRDRYKRGKLPAGVVTIPDRYRYAAKTPLRIEVAEGASPGAYDLRLTSW